MSKLIGLQSLKTGNRIYICLPVGRDQPVDGVPHHGEDEAGVEGSGDIRRRPWGQNIRQPDNVQERINNPAEKIIGPVVEVVISNEGGINHP